MHREIDPGLSPTEFDRQLRAALDEMVACGLVVRIPSRDGNPDNDLFVMPQFLPTTPQHKEEIN